MTKGQQSQNGPSTALQNNQVHNCQEYLKVSFLKDGHKNPASSPPRYSGITGKILKNLLSSPKSWFWTEPSDVFIRFKLRVFRTRGFSQLPYCKRLAAALLVDS